MTEVAATYYDGRTSRAHPVQLRFTDDHRLVGIGDGVAFDYDEADVVVEPRVGQTRRFLRLPDGLRCEVADNDAIEAALVSWSSRKNSQWIHRLESSWRLVLLATVVLGLVAWVAIRYGLPAAASRVAFSLPEAATQRLGRDALRTLDRTVFKPSDLMQERQQELRAAIQDFLARIGDSYPYKIEFRASESLGANALALPSGEIVITDELIELASDDREIVGVFAHECGHVHHRHVLRSVLQNSAIVVVFSLISGDVSSTTALGGALPTFLLQNKFSREFEAEADREAVLRMRRAGLDPRHLADMLERLAKHRHHHDGGVLDYVSTHPPAPERVQAINGAR